MNLITCTREQYENLFPPAPTTTTLLVGANIGQGDYKWDSIVYINESGVEVTEQLENKAWGDYSSYNVAINTSVKLLATLPRRVKVYNSGGTNTTGTGIIGDGQSLGIEFIMPDSETTLRLFNDNDSGSIVYGVHVQSNTIAIQLYPVAVRSMRFYSDTNYWESITYYNMYNVLTTETFGDIDSIIAAVGKDVILNGKQGLKNVYVKNNSLHDEVITLDGVSIAAGSTQVSNNQGTGMKFTMPAYDDLYMECSYYNGDYYTTIRGELDCYTVV